MASVYARGKRLWCATKNERGKWEMKRTDYVLCHVNDEAKSCPVCRRAREDAEEYADEAQKAVDERVTAGTPNKAHTVRSYSRLWLMNRQARGVRSVRIEEGRIRNHVLPRLGSMRLDEVRPRTIRDLVRALVTARELAPRTIHHVYADLHVMFDEAVRDEILTANPCVLKRGELPSKVDKDPEWRTLATYTQREVEQLVSDVRLPVERRVLNALKALAGLRHGEAAGVRWRHYDLTLEPLGRLVIATSYDTGRTKTEVTRRVPVHPLLAQILASWRVSHWQRIYGRAPTADDLIVPTRAMSPIAETKAAAAFKEDLSTLGLRVDAGKHRARGGHDLRAWFITTCQEHGAHRDLLRVVTHTAKGDVVSGYTRATWGALCGEVGKLRVSLLDGKLLELSTELSTREKRARGRWSKAVRAEGLEPYLRDARTPTITRRSNDHTTLRRGFVPGCSRSDSLISMRVQATRKREFGLI
jgi:integrase